MNASVVYTVTHKNHPMTRQASSIMKLWVDKIPRLKSNVMASSGTKLRPTSAAFLFFVSAVAAASVQSSCFCLVFLGGKGFSFFTVSLFRLKSLLILLQNTSSLKTHADRYVRKEYLNIDSNKAVCLYRVCVFTSFLSHLWSSFIFYYSSTFYHGQVVYAELLTRENR